MKIRGIVLASVFVLLLALCAAPLVALCASAADALSAPIPERVALSDGRALLGRILPQDAHARRVREVRILRGDGEPGPAALLLPASAVVSRSAAPDAWTIEREDGPLLFGIPRALVAPGWRVESRDSMGRLLATLPAILRGERARLVDRIRASRNDPAAFAILAEDWERWLVRDDSTLLWLDRGDGKLLSARISGIVQATHSGDAGLLSAFHRLEWFLLASPGSWGSGGIRPAVVSVFQLALMAGLFAGLFGISTALWIHGRATGETWLVRGRSLVSNLAGIPGVVWGVAGSGLLVHGLGPLLDRAGGVARWSGGGLLWSGATLGALASPIVMALALEELDRIPERWRDVAWCCGATRLQIVRRIVLPSCWKGLLAAVLSGMARAAGETAPLLLTGAVHAFGGLAMGGDGLLATLSGGFLHPGVLALDSPWLGSDLERGQPLVALMLFLLALLCVGLDLVASMLRRRPAVEEVLP